MINTEARITLAIDAMGGDQGPQEVLAGVSKAVGISPRNTNFMLFGQEDLLGTSSIKTQFFPQNR